MRSIVVLAKKQIQSDSQGWVSSIAINTKGSDSVPLIAFQDTLPSKMATSD